MTAANPGFPVLYVITDNSYLSGSVNPDIDAESLDIAGETERMTIIVPSGYAVNLAHASGFTIGLAYLSTVAIGGGGKETIFQGPLVAMARTAYASNPSAQACLPGTPTAAWEMRVRAGAHLLDIPIAIGRSSAGTEFTLCFDDEHALGLEVSTVQFFPKLSFATPSVGGKYLFDAVVTPFAPDGTADASGAYELRAYEDLPASLTATATYSRSARTLTVRGTLKVAGKTPGGASIKVRALSSINAATSTLLGQTLTNARGGYVFNKRLAAPPKYLFSETTPTGYAACSGTSPQPAGCASYSVDGTGSSGVKVTTTN
jgi:hypothetical protein